MHTTIGETICKYRQIHKMTQEELANKLGVTSQAVSKWERSNGSPDVSMLRNICKVLGISANTLIGLENGIVENNDPIAQAEVQNHMFAEPIVLEIGADLIPCISEGLQTDYVNRKRIDLLQSTGMLLPIIRIRDNTKLQARVYRILAYDKELFQSDVTWSTYQTIIDSVVDLCRENYSLIINKHIVKVMIDLLNERFPGITEDIVPAKISLLQIERKLQEKINNHESIRDFIHILEEMEEELT